MDQRVYLAGATVFQIGAGVTAMQVKPSENQVGWRLQVLSGGSSGVAFVSGPGLTASAGFLLGTNVHELNGPAEFFLVAQGTTALVSAMILRGAGYSLKP